MTSHDVRPAQDAQGHRRHGDALSVVMPAYNEGEAVRSAVEALRRAAAVAAWPLRVIVVDDGSTDPESRRVLEEVARAGDVELIRQDNAGRYAARAVGLERVTTPYVLLLDARVRVEERSLTRLREAVEVEGAEVWNFDVTPAVTSVGAAFWTGITKVWWRDYFRDRRPVSFGVDDFDRYPKGTGAFFAPTELIRAAGADFSSHFADVTLASDDTRMLRNVAARAPINLSPEIMCLHTAKTGARQWSRQCLYRGTTFVDGYLTDRSRARRLLGGGALAVGLGLLTLVRRPRSTVGAGICGCLAAGAVTRRCGGTLAESASVAMLSPAFGLLFGLGILRGLRLASAPHRR